MLLRDFQEVTELDSQIINLQNELVSLYKKRAQAVAGDNPSPQHTAMSQTTTKQLYNDLTQAWDIYDVTLPTYTSVRPRLAKAQALIADLELTNPHLTGCFSVVMVPPTSILGLDTIAAFRNKQSFVTCSDYIHPDLTKTATAKNWRVLVAYTSTEGLELGSAANILQSNLYKLAGHDMRGLGILEYIALSLQVQAPIDISSWTLLLKGTTSTNQTVGSAAFVAGQYRFDTDDVHGLLTNDRFRPAIEIKAGKK